MIFLNFFCLSFAFFLGGCCSKARYADIQTKTPYAPVARALKYALPYDSRYAKLVILSESCRQDRLMTSQVFSTLLEQNRRCCTVEYYWVDAQDRRVSSDHSIEGCAQTWRQLYPLAYQDMSAIQQQILMKLRYQMIRDSRADRGIKDKI